MTQYELDRAFEVLTEMAQCFDSWFPFTPDEDSEDRKMDQERFCSFWLNFEYGTYSIYDYEYVVELLKESEIENDRYREALRVIRHVLYEEYDLPRLFRDDDY